TTTTVSITVTGTNDGPTARADSATGTEDQPVTFGVLGNDTDPDGDTLSVTGANVDPLKGSVVVNANGTLTFTPAANINGPVEVTYTISDGKGGTSTAIATVNIAPTADTAVLGTGTGAVKEDTPAQTTASGTLSIVDPDAGEVAFQPQTDVPGLYGTLTLAADGAWTYTLDNSKPEVQALKEGETRPETFTVTSVDGTTTTVSITVTGTNDGPTAVADLAATNEDLPVTFTVLGNDTDPDGDTLSVTGANVDPLKGSVVVNANGTLTFTPAANINGPVEVTYTISDGKGGTSTAIATVNVAPQNDAPVAANDLGAVTEDATLSVSATNGLITSTATPAGTDRDIDGDTLTISAIRTGAENASGTAGTIGTAITGTYGTLTVQADGSYTYVANHADALAAGAPATDVFTYTVSDGSKTDTAELVITVTGTNDAPVIVGTLPDFNSSDALAVTLPTAAGFADPDAGDVL
ncbi:Ig-like domain-containing protein, partial [Zoogloea sp.]|uniref:Ig-like domain-containing protein n=1 Tax=Zoogloea sp. TaxID=49181 RepID=UPI002603BAAB